VHADLLSGELLEALGAVGAQRDPGPVGEGEEREIDHLPARERHGRGAAQKVDPALLHGLEPALSGHRHVFEREAGKAEIAADRAGDRPAQLVGVHGQESDVQRPDRRQIERQAVGDECEVACDRGDAHRQHRPHAEGQEDQPACQIAKSLRRCHEPFASPARGHGGRSTDPASSPCYRRSSPGSGLSG
jgi:hypothetical protein